MRAIPATPLQWPAGWKRTEPAWRTRARFAKKREQRSTWRDAQGQEHVNSWSRVQELTIAEAVDRLRAELRLMGVEDDDLVISTNLQLRLDGLPKSSQREPEDPGVCVYWIDPAGDSREPRCMAIDRYDRVADNLAAVAATLEAMRAIARHGGAEILSKAFTGFVALEDQRFPWWDVLGVPRDARRTEIDAAYRRRRSETHPDRGGDAVEFDRVQRAFESATQAAGA